MKKITNNNKAKNIIKDKFKLLQNTLEIFF